MTLCFVSPGCVQVTGSENSVAWHSKHSVTLPDDIAIVLDYVDTVSCLAKSFA